MDAIHVNVVGGDPRAVSVMTFEYQTSSKQNELLRYLIRSRAARSYLRQGQGGDRRSSVRPTAERLNS